MRKLVCVLLCLFSPMLLAQTAVSRQYNHLVFFGDSLSDNGNLYKYSFHIIPKSPPYFKGRFSNGLVWADLLEGKLSSDGKIAVSNFAVGGAGAIISAKANLPYTLWTEVREYLYLFNYHDKATSLYAIWIGANNYMNGPTNVDAITRKVVDGISNGIKKLIDNGATMFLLVNLPDLGLTPGAKQQGSPMLLSKLSRAHNQKLYQQYLLLKEQYPEVSFVYFDIDAFLTKVIENASAYGVTNTRDACYEGGYALQLSKQQLSDYLNRQVVQSGAHLSSAQVEVIVQNASLKEALTNAYAMDMGLGIKDKNCDGYVFWDKVHPSTKMHEILANELARVIANSEISVVH